MGGSRAAYIAVYCLAVLLLLLIVLFGLRAWQQYRRTMREVLERRRARGQSRTNHLETDDYWRGPPPPRLGDAVAVHIHSPSHKPTAQLLVYTPEPPRVTEL